MIHEVCKIGMNIFGKYTYSFTLSFLEGITTNTVNYNIMNVSQDKEHFNATTLTITRTSALNNLLDQVMFIQLDGHHQCCVQREDYLYQLQISNLLFVNSPVHSLVCSNLL